eukprot:jgi/Astpho2/5243/Aster-x1282
MFHRKKHAHRHLPSADAAEADVLTEHEKLESYARAGAHAAVAQAFQELLAPSNMKALDEIVVQQAGNVARQAITEDGRRGSRISALEAFTGSYDAIERKWTEAWQCLPQTQLYILCVAAAILSLLILGLTLALWRFVFFGV